VFVVDGAGLSSCPRRRVLLETIQDHPDRSLTLITRVPLRHDCILRKEGSGIKPGTTQLDPETERAVHPGDVVAQARFTYERVLQVLEAAGGGPEHLLRTVEYVCPVALADYRGVGGVRKELLRAPWPASTGVVCAALLRPEFLFEVDPTAVLSA